MHISKKQLFANVLLIGMIFSSSVNAENVAGLNFDYHTIENCDARPGLAAIEYSKEVIFTDVCFSPNERYIEFSERLTDVELLSNNLSAPEPVYETILSSGKREQFYFFNLTSNGASSGFVNTKNNLMAFSWVPDSSRKLRYGSNSALAEYGLVANSIYSEKLLPGRFTIGGWGHLVHDNRTGSPNSSPAIAGELVIAEDGSMSISLQQHPKWDELGIANYNFSINNSDGRLHGGGHGTIENKRTKNRKSNDWRVIEIKDFDILGLTAARNEMLFIALGKGNFSDQNGKLNPIVVQLSFNAIRVNDVSNSISTTLSTPFQLVCTNISDISAELTQVGTLDVIQLSQGDEIIGSLRKTETDAGIRYEFGDDFIHIDADSAQLKIGNKESFCQIQE